MWRVAPIVALSACSLAFMTVPGTSADRCSTQLEAPITDTVIAGAAAVLVAVASVHSIGPTAYMPTLAAYPIAAVYGTSAVYGYYARASCLRARTSVR